MVQKPEFNSNSIFKDALLPSLYAQVDFLKHEHTEKNLVLKTLVIKKSEVNTCYAENTNNSKKNPVLEIIISVNDANSEILVPEEISYKEIENYHFMDEQFKDLYRQFEKEKVEREKQNLNDQLHKIRGKKA